jgi:hypothetical protein
MDEGVVSEVRTSFTVLVLLLVVAFLREIILRYDEIVALNTMGFNMFVIDEVLKRAATACNDFLRFLCCFLVAIESSILQKKRQ